jgi:hypothetical protein
MPEMWPLSAAADKRPVSGAVEKKNPLSEHGYTHSSKNDDRNSCTYIIGASEVFMDMSINYNALRMNPFVL